MTMALPVFSVHVATDTHVGSVVADGQSSIFTSVYYCNQEVIQQHKHIFAIAALRTSVPVHTPYPSRTRSHTRPYSLPLPNAFPHTHRVRAPPSIRTLADMPSGVYPGHAIQRPVPRHAYPGIRANKDGETPHENTTDTEKHNAR